MTTITQNGTNFLIIIWCYNRSGEINMNWYVKRHDVRVNYYTMGMNYCARRKTGYRRAIA